MLLEQTQGTRVIVLLVGAKENVSVQETKNSTIKEV